jgi:formylglycine-generating enzyme required for sulfatase activity
MWKATGPFFLAALLFATLVFAGEDLQKRGLAGGGEYRSPVTGARFVLIPAGQFMMGSSPVEPQRHKDEMLHQVNISKPFYLQTTEVTQGQWKRVMGKNPSQFDRCGDDCPVETLSWNDVQAFIRKLNQMENADRYRLPTEAQWEYAARAGTGTPFYTGRCLGTDQANYNGSHDFSDCPKGDFRRRILRVGSFPPNAWGLYDMHGNVWEWVQDWYGDYPSTVVTDPVGPSSGTYRTLRGGGWGSNAGYCRSAVRFFYPPDFRYRYLGFRLAATP